MASTGHGTNDLSMRALTLRESGETYRAIGAALEISCGKAHHLVTDARARGEAAENRGGKDNARPTHRSATERRAQRDTRIAMASLGGVPNREIAETHGLQVRTVRRILAKERKRRETVVPLAVKAMEDAYEKFKEALREADAARQSLDDPESTMAHLERRITAITAMTDAFQIGGAMSPFSYISARQAQAEAESEARAELVDKTHELNNGLLQLLSDAEVDGDVIEGAIDLVMAVMGHGEMGARRRTMFMPQHVRPRPSRGPSLGRSLGRDSA